MPRRDFERADVELKTKELELVGRLVARLREVAAGRNTLFFFTPEHNPHGFNFDANWLANSSYDLLKLARDTVELRELLVLPIEGCIGQRLEAACIENADPDNPHRLGPIRRAARLLSEIEQLQKAAP